MTTKEKQKWDRIYKTYGISLIEWTEILLRQQRVCHICKTMPKNKILCVDHIHQKGYKTMTPMQKKKYVRGLLCYMCNTGLKCVEKTANGKRNRQQLVGMVEYFNEFPLKGEIE